MLKKSFLRRLLFSALTVLLFSTHAHAAGIRIVPSVNRAEPGESLYFDVVAEDLPSEGLSAFKFRLDITANGASVNPVQDTSLGQESDISIAAPILIGPATSTRSGLGSFFLNGTGPNGILSVDNQGLSGGSAVFTFGHTNGYVPVSGSGPLATFRVKVGANTSAESINLGLSEAMLFVNGSEHPVTAVAGAEVGIGCTATVPDFTGLSQSEAQNLIHSSKLSLGNVYEIDNTSGAYPLGQVIGQSISAGTRVTCNSAVGLAINNAPQDISQAQVFDKEDDDSGTVVITWLPSQSPDLAGYRIFAGETLLAAIDPLAGAAGTELGGLQLNQLTQIRIAAFDTFGNQSPGVFLSAYPLDDVAPVITIGGVSDGSYYNTDVTPAIAIQEGHPASQAITLNGSPYNGEPLTSEGTYLISVTASDTAGNSSGAAVSFVIDKTLPAVTIANLLNGGFYNIDLSPAISAIDLNLGSYTVLLNGIPYTGGVLSAEGLYSIEVNASDLAGNSSVLVYSFQIDKTSPQSSLAFGVPVFQNAGADYVSGATPITISGTDPGATSSGIDVLEYRINAGEWTAYSSPFTITGQPDGIYSIDYRARDRAGNVESANSISFTVDATSPLTQIDVSAPAYQGGDGKLYAGSGSLVSLSAADGTSGVKASEYKVGSGVWTNYTVPFALSSEGEHIIAYRSSDNVDNVEPEKSKSVTLDLTPPVTIPAFSGPEYVSGSTRYVSSSTSLNFTATDNLSGVASTQYKIGAGAYVPAAPFSLETEGAYQLTFKSIDNIGNAEAEQAFDAIVDNTPPAIQLTIGEPSFTGQGGIVYAQSATQFNLAATDGSSGVALTEYRVDGGNWQPYTQFSLAEGAHTVEYRSTDRVGNSGAIASIQVEVENALTINKSMPDYPRVLVWLNACIVQDGGTGDCLDQNVIQAALDAAGVTYYVVKSKSAFQGELLSNYYTDYLIIGDSAALDELQAKELRERVNFGSGLIVSLLGSSPLYESFGISSAAALVDTNLGITFSQSDIYDAASYQTSGRAVNASVSGGETIAWLGTNNDYPGVIRKTYGRGKGMFFAFDLGLTISANAAQFSAILGAALNHTHMPVEVQQSHMPYDLISQRISITNNWDAFDVRVNESYPASIHLIDSASGQLVTDNPWATTLQLANGGTGYVRFFALTPDLQGPFTLSSSVDYMKAGSWTHYSDVSNDIVIDKSTAALIADIISALDGLSLTGQEQTDRDAARQAIAAARDRVVLGAAEMDQNIQDVVAAAENVKKIISTDISAIRLEIGKLLRIWTERRYLEN